METNLRQALGTDQLSLHYQPKLRVATVNSSAWKRSCAGNIRLSAASRRQSSSDRGRIRLILPLGEWILGEACRQVAEWRNRGLGHLCCAVNLSAAQFRERNLPTMIARILQESHVDASQLQLELTESLLMEEAGAAQTMLRSLRDLGISLAVDDFGTGYSSLNYLNALPLDVLKIDQSFIRELREDSDDAAIVEAVIAMAHSLRLAWWRKASNWTTSSSSSARTAATKCRATCSASRCRRSSSSLGPCAQRPAADRRRLTQARPFPY